MAADPLATGRELSYAELVRALFPRLTGGIRWGTERTARMLAALGNPHESAPVVHVGGTNGKGSVAATVASVLSRSGLRTGLYTSPHLCSFRERIRIDGRAVTEPTLLAAARRAWPEIEREGPSFFEATTVIAFEVFARVPVDIVVVEVGLGGRLDATNVVRPEVVALTNVARDHMEFLGDSLTSIAGEKAGIIKAGHPVVTAETGDEALAVFRDVAAARGAGFWMLDRETIRDVSIGLAGTELRLETAEWGALRLHTPLIGRHQATNTALAVRALELLPVGLRPAAEAVQRGVAEVHWPGRLQVVEDAGTLWLYDAAHNPAGVKALAAALSELRPTAPRAVLAAILADKPWQEMLPALAAGADTLVLTTAPSAPDNRRWEPAEAGAWLAARPEPGTRLIVEPDFAAALNRAAQAGAGGSVLVAGSFHTVGDALAAQGRAPDGVDAYLPVLPSAV